MPPPKSGMLYSQKGNVGMEKQTAAQKKKIMEQQDYEANVFAAYLLIPTELLNKELKAMKGIDVSDEKAFKSLCKKFNVSSGVMAFRLTLINK